MFVHINQPKVKQILCGPFCLFLGEKHKNEESTPKMRGVTHIYIYIYTHTYTHSHTERHMRAHHTLNTPVFRGEGVTIVL